MEMTTDDPQTWRMTMYSSEVDTNIGDNASCAVYTTFNNFPDYWIFWFLWLRLVRIFIDLSRLAIIPTILGYFSCCLWTYYNNESRDHTCSKPLPPGGYGLPFIGETFHFLFGGKYFLQQRRTMYGNVHKTHILGLPTIRVTGPENVRRIIRGENSLVTTQWPKSTGILLGQGSISHATGESHASMKKSVMKAFSHKALSGYVPIIQKVVTSYIRKWCSKTRVLGYPELKTMNFDLSCRVLMGFEMCDTECQYLMEVFETFIANIFCIPMDHPCSGLRKGLKSRQILLQKIEDHIRMRESRKDSDSCDNDALSQIMKMAENERLSNHQLKNLCLELMFAGHGTTSSAASFLIFQLCKHPEVVTKILAELSNNIQDSGNGPILDLQSINKLTYVKNVVKEALRLSPPIGGAFRKALKTFEIDGYQIPEGWAVIYSIGDTHQTLDSINNVEDFNPDRWSDSAIPVNGFQYLPFGGGKRACAGKELAQLMLRILVIELVRCCTWKMEKTDSRFKSFPMPHPVDDLPLTFTAL